MASEVPDMEKNSTTDETSVLVPGTQPSEYGTGKSSSSSLEVVDDGALSTGPAINILSWKHAGYLAQYFSVGIIYGGLPSTVYGFFLGYLNVPAHVYSTTGIIMTLPWSFKFLFGLINDCFPIMGYRRKPYMVLGWGFCAFMLVVLANYGLPEPYWCRAKDGSYITKTVDSMNKTIAAEPCNPRAQTSGGQYAMLMMLAALGYVVADVAADGLTVEYARREPVKKRGQTQTTAYLTRSCGQILAILTVGFLMNGKEYNGTFDFGLSFNAICGLFSIPAAIMVPVSWYGIQETKVKERQSFQNYMDMSWKMLTSKAMFYVILYQFLTPVIGNISTTAGGLVKNYWAKVQNLQNQMFSVVGHGIFAWGLWLVKKHFLNHSWRKMLVSTTVFLNVTDMFFVFCTVFNVIRNQYFYLGETVLIEVPAAANFVVSTFVVVEMAETGNEGLVYGLLTTTHNLGSPFARAMANQLYSLFKPALSDSKNYVEDSPAFRWTVASSFIVSYCFAFASLSCLYFLPEQKAQTQHRKRTWPQHVSYAKTTVVLLSVAMAYSLTVNFLSMFESTMCLRFAGGKGCDLKAAASLHNKTSSHPF